MSVNPSTIPGLNMPTQTGMLAGNPRDSAIASQNLANDKLTALNKVDLPTLGKPTMPACKAMIF